MSAAGLFDALGVIPALPGAACRGRTELFDERHPDEPDEQWTYRSQSALRVCTTCPSLTACTRWLDALPQGQRPRGVVAGQINQPAAGRPRAVS